jgi:hypothetical protein
MCVSPQERVLPTHHVICPAEMTPNCKWISISAPMRSLTSPSISESTLGVLWSWTLVRVESGKMRWNLPQCPLRMASHLTWHHVASQWASGEWPWEWPLISIYGIPKEDTAHLAWQQSPVESIFQKYCLLVPEHLLLITILTSFPKSEQGQGQGQLTGNLA